MKWQMREVGLDREKQKVKGKESQRREETDVRKYCNIDRIKKTGPLPW